MAVPFRIGVMQLTMEPLDEMLESARVMDQAGMDTVWLAEAYPWWRKHQMEARGSTVVSALMARETERLTIGWGIISPFTRHPVQVAMDARVVQEAAGPGRFILGFGTSKIFLNNARMQTKKTLGPMRDAVEIVRGVLGGEAFSYEGDTWSADVPALSGEAHTPREVPPVYVAATAPKMQALAGEIAEGCLTPSITTPAFVRYTVGNTGSDIDIGCTVVASIDEDRDRGRDGAREIAGMYLANKVQNIQGSADTLLDLAELTQEEIRPVAEAMERGGRLAAKARGDGRDPRQVQADRRHARRLHRARSRSTATPAAHTSCWSCGATSDTTRSGSSARRCCRISATDRILADARGRIARYEPRVAEERARNGSVIVDLRSHDERARDGVIPGSVHVPRSVLEWRVDPGSGYSNPVVADEETELILVCQEGYSSSLAAASLAELGHGRVGDLVGGFVAWRASGLETIAAPSPPDGLPGMGGPDR